MVYQCRYGFGKDLCVSRFASIIYLLISRFRGHLSGKGPYECRRVSFFLKNGGKKVFLSERGRVECIQLHPNRPLCEDGFSTCGGSHLDQPLCDKKSVRFPHLFLSRISIPFGLPDFCQLQNPRLMFLSLSIFLQPREMFAQTVA